MKSETFFAGKSKAITLGVAVTIFVFATYGLLPATRTSGTVPMNNAVTFHQNDYIGDSVMTSQVASSEVALTLFNSLEVKFSNPGFTFDYWTTVPDGSGTEYTDG